MPSRLEKKTNGPSSHPLTQKKKQKGTVKIFNSRAAGYQKVLYFSKVDTK